MSFASPARLSHALAYPVAPAKRVPKAGRAKVPDRWIWDTGSANDVLICPQLQSRAFAGSQIMSSSTRPTAS